MVPINFLHVVQRPPTDQIQIHLFHIFRSTEQMFQKYYIYLQSLIPLILKLFIHYLLSSSGQAPALAHNHVLKSTSQDRPSNPHRGVGYKKRESSRKTKRGIVVQMHGSVVRPSKSLLMHRSDPNTVARPLS
jgi:hypothetical protein